MENTESFKKINATYAENSDEACNAFEFRSDAYWKCYVQQNTIPWIHLVGTCRMGPDSDTSNDSVVDSKFRYAFLETPVVSASKMINKIVLPRIKFKRSARDTSIVIAHIYNFRVRGVQNLRIVDGSIMPAVTNANINAPIVMIAEKAAHEIAKTWHD